MIQLTDAEIERLVSEDISSDKRIMDFLGIAGSPGEASVTVCSDTAVCGTEEAVSVFIRLGLDVKHYTPSGTFCNKGDQILGVEGDIAAICTGWRIAAKLMIYASGIAERTRRLVMAARSEVSEIMVVGSGNHPPVKTKLLQKALQSGGAMTRCAGMANTTVILQDHLTFMGGYERLHHIVANLRRNQPKQMVAVEVINPIDALVATRSGAHFIQASGMPPQLFGTVVHECRKVAPWIGIIASGEISDADAPQYAAAGADVLETSWVYSAAPAEMAFHATPVNERALISEANTLH